MRRFVLAVAFVILFGSALCVAREITVAADGSGTFKTVQAAVDSVPAGNTERVVIAIKNGTYNEQVRIQNSFITLRGQNRKGTKITSLVDTSACPVTPGQSVEEHCATVIADGTDIVVENLTVENTYKGAKGKGAALSFVENATRIVLVNVDVIGFGGDTLALTARRNRIGDGGEYYLNNVYVSGTYHIIVPRGNTYVVDSNFVCLGAKLNCLFAEGITRERDKLVIRRSTIEGPEPFKLGSYFRDAAWYFVDDSFSDTLMADGQIRREPAKNYEMKWGEARVYFAGNKGPDYPWLKDNIEKSPARSKQNVTVEWVLPEWNPETTAAPTIKRLEQGPDAIRVIFSESVTVRGTPVLKLKAGKYEYVSGSGTDTLVFRKGTHSANQGKIFASAASVHERTAKLTLPR